MAASSYRCGLLPGNNCNKTNEELCSMKGTSIEKMKIILSSYDIPSSDIFIVPYAQPYSSYAYQIDEEYLQN
jgi:hypothetical protein